MNESGSRYENYNGNADINSCMFNMLADLAFC